jgi:hypothetical protein
MNASQAVAQHGLSHLAYRRPIAITAPQSNECVCAYAQCKVAPASASCSCCLLQLQDMYTHLSDSAWQFAAFVISALSFVAAAGTLM